MNWRPFRKRPIVVLAYRTEERLEIETLEGTMTANPGDWIIEGTAGERYPCKPEIFKKIFEAVGPGRTCDHGIVRCWMTASGPPSEAEPACRCPCDGCVTARLTPEEPGESA